ncbi:MAG: FG-GAP-like repeat-containing protein [Bacteroidota bacterium]
MKEPYFTCCAGLLSLLLFHSCRPDEVAERTLFSQINPSYSGVHFKNTLSEDTVFNIIEYLYFYNGGGVAAGDINNDGLVDLYFSANQQPNKLYLNQGNFHFRDITASAGAEGVGNWKTGVSMADVNGDGWLDIFVCGVGKYKKFNSKNQIYVNNGDLTFTERSAEYGLSFQGFSTHAAFFDYDLDGDLDMYLLNHAVHTQSSYGKVRVRYQEDSLAGDKLYRNMLREDGKTFFLDATREAGIHSSPIGYGLGVAIADLNQDGYPDIYVSNDFIENDYLYINSRNGTFSQQLEASMPHCSRFSMGNDVADINNDGWADVLTLDMLPRDESVIKTSAGEDSYEVYAFKLKYGYHRQVSRNALQINLGILDSGRLSFQDIAPAAGVSATDWSWAPLITDFDGDGWKDIFISNGIVRRPNDLDYLNYISADSIQRMRNILPWIAKMPEGKVSNFVFRNRRNLTFEDATKAWGIDLPSFSNGAAVADLDNNGTPDLVVNRINDTPLIYRNNSSPEKFVKVRLHGDSLTGNKFAIGAKIGITQIGVTQIQELFPARGFCSSSDFTLTFGLLDARQNFTVSVIWPDGSLSTQTTKKNNVLLKHSERLKEPARLPASSDSTIFEPVKLVNFRHRENEFNAFSREALIPQMLTNDGPALAVGDVNGDGLEDVFIGGGKNQGASLFMQERNGSFTLKPTSDFVRHRASEKVAATLFDADGDGDLDLTVVSGGQEEAQAKETIQPCLYKNDGRGNLQFSKSAFLNIFLQASCVKPEDYDRDGDVDLFIGASVMPGLYGMSPMSYLLRNDGKGIFTPDTRWLGQSQFDNPTRVRPGMVKDATWCDINKDNLPDLVLVGEWMPITLLLQQPDHQFVNVTARFGLQNTRGLWNAIVAKDFDRDGDIDLVGGNLGLNSRIQTSEGKPLRMYLGDFDSNGGSDHILVYYNGDQAYPFQSRDQLVKQMPGLKKKFLNYKDYRNVRLDDIVTPQQKGNSALMQADMLSSVYLKNEGAAFVTSPLPFEAQLFPVFDLRAEDVDGDGQEDLIMVGNQTLTQPEIGPYDAGLGLVLKSNGNGEFRPLSPAKSGFFVKGEGRKIEVLQNVAGEKIYLVARNNNTVLTFKKKTK